MARRDYTGRLYVVCPKSLWKATIDKNCVLYTLTRTGTPSRYKLVVLHAPEMWASPEWQTFRDQYDHPLNKLFRHSWRIRGGQSALCSITKRAFEDMIYKDSIDVESTIHHVYVGNIVTSLKETLK
jgi:hypothetical protein